MPSKSPKKTTQSDKKKKALRDACINALSTFGNDGATLQMLIREIRDTADHDAQSENSPNGERGLKALLQHGTEFETVCIDLLELRSMRAW